MATIKDIARATGVSAMTVSRYFNSPDKLKEKTYEKIKAAVDDMGYEPNQIARLLATRKTNIICVYIAGDIDALHPFTLQAISGIGERLGQDGYSMLLSRDTYKKTNCDGIIAMGLSEQQEEELMELSNNKAIIVFGNSSHKKNWIDINNYKGSYEATEYMIKRGYTHIANVGICNDQSYPAIRFKGYKDCMEFFKLDIPEGGALRTNNHEEDGYYAAKKILQNNEVDAIVCASDALAIGVVRCANEMGLKIPEELGIIGFDGLGYEKLATPCITTMEQPVYSAGKELAQMMINVLDIGHYNGTGMFIDPILRVNGTTK